MFKPANLTDPIKNNEAIMDWLFDENLAEYQCYHMLFWVEYGQAKRFGGPCGTTMLSSSRWKPFEPKARTNWCEPFFVRCADGRQSWQRTVVCFIWACWGFPDRDVCATCTSRIL